MELRSSESDFLLGLLLPDEDIMGCKRFQILDEFTTSFASYKIGTWVTYPTYRAEKTLAYCKKMHFPAQLKSLDYL